MVKTTLEELKRKKYINGLRAFILALVCYIVYIFTHRLYVDTDGYMISTVINRVFDSDNYCIFLHPWLCGLAGALSDLFKKADALVLLEHILFFIEFVFLFYVIFSSEKSGITKALYIVFMVSISQVIGCWNANFTVQAAALAGGGIALLYSGRKRLSTGLKLSGTMFAMFGAMLRIESALFFVPFIILDVFFEFIFYDGDKKVLTKDLLHLWTIPVLLFSVLVAVQFAYNSSPKYAQSVEYSRARAEIVDYQYKPWEEVQSSLPDVTKTEYEAICRWNLADTDCFDIEKLRSIAIYGKRAPFPTTVKGFIDVIPWMFFLFCGSTINVKFMAITISVIFILLITSGLPWWRKLESALAVLGGGIIIWFFIFIGRAPFRIWEAVFLAVFTLLIIISSDMTVQPRLCSFFRITGIVIVVICLSINFKSLKIIKPQLPSSSREYGDSVEYNNDNIYIWNKDPAASFKEIGKLPTREYLAHNIVEGDWIYGQVYFENFLKAYDVQNPAEALASRNNVFYVSEDCQPMLEYLREHFKENLQAMQIGIVDDFPVWKFY